MILEQVFEDAGLWGWPVADASEANRDVVGGVTDWDEYADWLEHTLRGGEESDYDRTWRAAYHEAGHAIAAALCGVQWTHATVVPSGQVNGYVAHEEIEDPHTLAFVAWAGIWAEAYWLDCDLLPLTITSGANDMETVEAYWNDSLEPESEDDWEGHMRVAWGAVEDLAERLFEERMISAPA